MKKGISGVTIIKNANRLGYPFYYSVKSIIDACDEFIISEGHSDDSTMEIIKQLQKEYPTKIVVFQDEWNQSRKGETISTITNNALERCNYEWIYCIQADEIVHEDNINFIRQIPYRQQLSQSISFEFTHYRPTLRYVTLAGYSRAIRMFKNRSKSIRKKFRIWWQTTNLGGYLKNKLPVDPLMAFEDIYSDTDGFTFAGSVFPVSRPIGLKPIHHVGYVSSDIKKVYAKMASHATNLYTGIDKYEKMAEKLSNSIKVESVLSVWQEYGFKISEYHGKDYPKLLIEWADKEGIDYNK